MSRPANIAPTRFERFLGALSLALLAAMILAIFRGQAEWHNVPVAVWIHMATVGLALALTAFLLWRRRGTRVHRVFGYLWAGLMLITALVSLDIRMINSGAFSPIHLLSVAVIILLPIGIFAARNHQVARHRRAMRGMIIGALLTAGSFTFIPSRMLADWLYG